MAEVAVKSMEEGGVDLSGKYGEDADILEEQAQRLDALGLEISKKRSEAIEWRADTGIEREWIEDEEHYEGIDEANRNEFGNSWRSKPPGQADIRDSRPQGSTAFFNITRPYVDAASARVGDMLLPTDDRGWSIQPTPVPDLVAIAEGDIPPHIQMQVASQNLGDAEGGQKALQQIQADAEKQIKEAKKKAEKAEKRIDDWHVECQYHAEMRQIIEDASRIGTGVLKGPIPMRRKKVAYIDGKLVIESELAPASFRVDVWNCFPAAGCGQSIHDGDHFFERDDITAKRLRDLKEQPGYFAYQIDKCLEEKPMQAVKDFDTQSSGRPNVWGLKEREGSGQFEIWYYYGHLEREELLACGCDESELPEEVDFIPVLMEVVNNHVIKAAVNPLDTGEFPYDFMVWQRREGLPWGIGVARQARVPQRVVNAAGRNMLNNAGVGGSPMFIFKQGIVTPVDGSYEIAPFKAWQVSEDSDLEDVTKAFTFIQIPMVQAELEAIIQFGLKMAEDITGLPMLLQGQMGKAPDTVGGMKILNDNAGAPLRRIARLFDDLITEPHIRRYYNYLLQHGPDDEKGDFQIDARGSSALVERDLSNQAIREMGNLVMQPVFKIDPKKWMSEYLKSQKLDVRRFEYDDEEWQQLVEQMAASAQKGDSSVEVAQIRAQTDLQKHGMTMQDKGQEREFKIALEAMRKEKEDQDTEILVALKALEREMDQLELSQKSAEHDKQIKNELAQLVMKLRTQVQLSQERTSQAATPPTEPAGRAENGKAYQQ